MESHGLVYTEQSFSVEFVNERWACYYNEFSADIEYFIEWLNDGTGGEFERVFVEELNPSL